MDLHVSYSLLARLGTKRIPACSTNQTPASVMNRVLERTDFLVVGCGPAGATAAREAARNSIPTVVLERDPVVGQKRVCAAGLRPGFCRSFDLPSSLVHCDTPRLALFDAAGDEHEIFFG